MITLSLSKIPSRQLHWFGGSFKKERKAVKDIDKDDIGYILDDSSTEGYKPIRKKENPEGKEAQKEETD